MRVHEPPGALPTLGGQVWTATEQRPNPLLMDSLGPFRTKKVQDSEFEQQIP